MLPTSQRIDAAVTARVQLQRGAFPRRKHGGAKAPVQLRPPTAIPVQQGTALISHPLTEPEIYAMKVSLLSHQTVTLVFGWCSV